MKREASLNEESSLLWSLRMFSNPFLSKHSSECFGSIMKNFFYLQYMQAVFKRKKIVRSDHILDGKIPFTPEKVNIYLDFIAYWIRAAGFFMRHFGREGIKAAGEILDSINEVYKRAAEVYRIKFSTTRRPAYYAHLKFVTIHFFDPHLMCIPSLHVMVIIRTYTLFKKMISRLGGEKKYSKQIEEIRIYGMAIVEAVLFIKQHSVNCISASMYAMSCIDPELFTGKDAEIFVSDLFAGCPSIKKEDIKSIREHIFLLYSRFLNEGKENPDWKKPLLDFLDSLPEA